jgi:hypothetical protein
MRQLEYLFDEYFPHFLVAVVVALVVWATWATWAESRTWESFKIAHNCQVVGQKRGSVQMGMSSNGSAVSMVSPSETGWLCDDGVTYWR